MSHQVNLLDALKQGAKENVKDSWLWRRVDCDAGAVVFHGALTGRVAFLLGWSEDATRRRLYAMHRAGTVLIYQYKKGQPIRWWPVGLFAEMQGAA